MAGLPPESAMAAEYRAEQEAEAEQRTVRDGGDGRVVDIATRRRATGAEVLDFFSI